MAQGKGLWLIGVRKDELTPSAEALFISQLLQRYRGRENKREGVVSVVRKVHSPSDVSALQRHYGKEYVEFYYVNGALAKAAENALIKLNLLKFVFGVGPGTQVFRVVSLPPEYAD